MGAFSKLVVVPTAQRAASSVSVQRSFATEPAVRLNRFPEV
jgi:hypothetical protein